MANLASGVNSKVNAHKDLLVWHKAMDLVEEVYAITSSFPQEANDNGLASKMRNSSVAVPSNIAEGSSQQNTNGFMAFIGESYGHLAELETQMILANRLGYIDDTNYSRINSKIDESAEMLNGLRASLNSQAE